MTIRFTRHAEDKFRALEKEGIYISLQIIMQTLAVPDHIEYTQVPVLIAKKRLDESHVLRVVYRKEKETIIIITFYPGNTSKYEKH